MNIDYVVVPILLGIVAAILVTVSVRRLRSLRAGRYSRARRIAERVALLLVCVVATVVAASSLFNAVAVARFKHGDPPAGQRVMVDGHSMHIRCMGSGAPTLVLETGLGDDSLVWAELQPELAKTTRVCAYDRAGFGWSDSGPAPRDADSIARELHDLLADAGVSGPIVLMGHSLGGLYIRDYAAHYRAQVAGLIFLDSSSPFQDKNPAFANGGAGPPTWLLRTAMDVGVPRVIGMCSGGKHDAGYALRKERAEHVCGLHFGSMSGEIGNFDRSSAEVQQPATFGDLPVLVISHDPAKMLGPTPSPQEVARQEAWSQMQRELTKLSTNSGQIVAIGSGHYVMGDRRDLVAKEVPRFIENVRGAGPAVVASGESVRE